MIGTFMSALLSQGPKGKSQKSTVITWPQNAKIFEESDSEIKKLHVAIESCNALLPEEASHGPDSGIVPGHADVLRLLN